VRRDAHGLVAIERPFEHGQRREQLDRRLTQRRQRPCEGLRDRPGRQAVDDVGRGAVEPLDADAGAEQLERQRQAGGRPAQRGHSRRVELGAGETGPGRLGAVDEQPHGGRTCVFGGRGRRGGHGERFDLHGVLRPHPERLA
jgi:hypothetical protein